MRPSNGRARPVHAEFQASIFAIQQKVPAIEYPAEDFERIMRVNVVGSFLTAKYAAKIMVENGTRGSIVLIASMSGNIANRVSTCSETFTDIA